VYDPGSNCPVSTNEVLGGISDDVGYYLWTDSRLGRMMKLLMLTIMVPLTLPAAAFGGGASDGIQDKTLLNCCVHTEAAVASTKTRSAVSLGDLGFDVTVALSEKAAVDLAKENADVIVFASYYGDPKKNAKEHTNEVGLIDVSSAGESVKIGSTGGRAHVSGAKVDAATFDWVSGPVKVNVNVASESRSSSQNMLDCDFIDGPLEDVQEQAPVTLNCYLIEESHPDTSLRP